MNPRPNRSVAGPEQPKTRIRPSRCPDPAARRAAGVHCADPFHVRIRCPVRGRRRRAGSPSARGTARAPENEHAFAGPTIRLGGPVGHRPPRADATPPLSRTTSPGLVRHPSQPLLVAADGRVLRRTPTVPARNRQRSWRADRMTAAPRDPPDGQCRWSRTRSPDRTHSTGTASQRRCRRPGRYRRRPSPPSSRRRRSASWRLSDRRAGPAAPTRRPLHGALNLEALAENHGRLMAGTEPHKFPGITTLDRFAPAAMQ